MVEGAKGGIAGGWKGFEGTDGTVYLEWSEFVIEIEYIATEDHIRQGTPGQKYE